MPERPDGETWELAGSIRVDRDGSGYTIVGGWEEPGAVGIRVIVHHPTDENLIRRVYLRLPLTVTADGRFEAGAPEEVNER